MLLGSNSQDGFDLMSGFLAHPAAFENFTELLPLLVFNKVDVTKKDMQLAEVVKRCDVKLPDSFLDFDKLSLQGCFLLPQGLHEDPSPQPPIHDEPRHRSAERLVLSR